MTMRRAMRHVVGLVLTLALASGDAAVARAHAVLLEADPPDGAVVAHSPADIADLPIPVSGTWTFSIAALVDDFDLRTVTTEVPIR